MNRKRLFVTDLDGTLLGADSLVSARSARIISELSQRGAQITVATARTPGTVEPLLARTLTLPPAVVMTGAALWYRGSLSYSSMLMLDSGRAAEVCAALRGGGIAPMVYQLPADTGVLTMRINKPTNPYERRFVGERSRLDLKKACICTDPEAYIAGGNTVLILAMGNQEIVRRVFPAVKAVDGVSAAMYTDPCYPGAGFIEVFTAGVNKARGLVELKRLTGADHVTVFGDSANDLPMMAESDVAVAVANASDEVKAAADIVIGPNTADSVAEYIADIFQPHNF